jgi:hypothetical protein
LLTFGKASAKKGKRKERGDEADKCERQEVDSQRKQKATDLEQHALLTELGYNL